VTAYGFEREEWRCAVEAAEDAGEIVDDRPTLSDLYDEEFDEGDVDDGR
jgi:hypothetical protein